VQGWLNGLMRSWRFSDNELRQESQVNAASAEKAALSYKAGQNAVSGANGCRIKPQYAPAEAFWVPGGR
jgi:hypothetical protein